MGDCGPFYSSHTFTCKSNRIVDEKSWMKSVKNSNSVCFISGRYSQHKLTNQQKYKPYTELTIHLLLYPNQIKCISSYEVKGPLLIFCWISQEEFFTQKKLFCDFKNLIGQRWWTFRKNISIWVFFLQSILIIWMILNF